MKVTPSGNKLFKLRSTEESLTYNHAQDSSKEDYIFCPECESAFNTRYERHIANSFYRSHKTKANFFIVRHRSIGLVYRVYTDTDYELFQKFWLLQLYRAHISNLQEFENFQLTKAHLQVVHRNLYDPKFFKDIKITIFSTDLLKDNSYNVICALHNKNESYCMYINEFVCIFQFDSNFSLIPGTEQGSNYLVNSPHVIYADLRTWANFRQVVFNLANQPNGHEPKSRVLTQKKDSRK